MQQATQGRQTRPDHTGYDGDSDRTVVREIAEDRCGAARSAINNRYHRPCSLVEVRRAIAQLDRLIYEPEDILRRKLHDIVPEFISPSDGVEKGMPLSREDQLLKVVV